MKTYLSVRKQEHRLQLVDARVQHQSLDVLPPFGILIGLSQLDLETVELGHVSGQTRQTLSS